VWRRRRNRREEGGGAKRCGDQWIGAAAATAARERLMRGFLI